MAQKSDDYTLDTAQEIFDAVAAASPRDLTTFVVEHDSQRGVYSATGGRLSFHDWSKGGWDFVGNQPGILP